MDGLMMDRPLLVKQIAERAEAVFGDREVVARTQDGIERSTYGQLVARARRLASALAGLGIGPGDRVASFAWNSLRHLELYLAVPSMGAVLHTLNIRLFEQDIRYIVDHADDRLIFLDASPGGPDAAVRGQRARGPDAGWPGRARGGARLRGARGRRRPGVRASRPRRELRGGHVLHERHHGPAKGGPVLAALDRAPHPRRGASGLDGHSRGRLRDARRADVPRDGVGNPVHRDDAGGQAGPAGTRSHPARAGRPDRLRGRHLERRRADDLERLPGARSAARPLQRPRAQGGWLRGAGAPDPRLRRALRRAHRPGLGNDRDQPARRRLTPARGGRSLETTRPTPCEPPRAASCRWSSSGSIRTRAASCRSVARGSRAPTTRTRAATRGSPTTDGCAPATSPS